MLRVEHLCLRFGGLKATNDVSMHVKPGRITALIGPNGAGKTTLFNQIAGVCRPDSGEIWFDGQRIDGRQPYEIHDLGISRTYQVINLFTEMTVLENVLVGMHDRLKSGFFRSLLHTPGMRREERAALERARELLAFVDLEDLAGERAGSLPYGKQRLLEIVRGMASGPKLLLLDEPAAGMNSAEKEALNAYIRKIIDRGITVLVVEHDMKLVMDISDEIYVIEAGKNLAFGPPEVVQKDPGVIKAYLGGDE